MNFSNNIRSYILLILYVLSGTHGALNHCNDSSHKHIEHSHNHDHHEEEISFLHSVTHSIIHSVAHLIEHSANDHDCCNIAALMVEVDTVNTANTTNTEVASILKPRIKFLFKQNGCKEQYIADHYKQIFLSLSSLRGPPSIV